METSICLCKVTYYDSFENKAVEGDFLVNGSNMSEIGEELDTMFGEDLMGCTLLLFEPHTALELSPEAAEAITEMYNKGRGA